MRTEFTFRRAYGPIGRVAERLQALGAPAAGIVDPNTWGHVRWEAALVAVGVEPLFGAEIVVPMAGERSPAAWVLARDTRGLYGWLSHAPAPTMEDWVRAAPFALRFAGCGLTDPETFDYVDTNPRSLLAGIKAVELARSTGKPLVVTSDNAFPAEEDWEAFLALRDDKRITPQWLLSDAELRAALPWLTDEEWRQAVRNTHEVAERLSGWRLPKAPIIQLDGDLVGQALAGKAYRVSTGHIARWTKQYEERLQRELEMIKEKHFESYFLVVGDLVRWAKQRMLVGPGRGSSAGSLVCFLLQITEVDPLPHNLLFERFIDVNRADLPDIDIDFSDRQRDSVFEYLADKYGRDNVARLGNVSTLKPRSAIAECCKKLGVPQHATYPMLNSLIEYSSGDSRYGNSLEDTLQQTAPGRKLLVDYPEAAIVRAVEGHAWHTSVHAAGVLVGNEPITNYCVVRDGIAQLDKPDSEKLNLLKIDALGLRTLGVIEDANVVSAQELYDLTLDDPKAFEVINNKKFAGVFQFEGAAQRRVSTQILVNSFQQLDHITALARPGPLGGGATNTYINRLLGKEPLTYRHPSMAAYLDDTMGVVIYQEQVMRIVREIGKFSWAETSTIRKAMSGRKGVEYFNQQRVKFVAGAATHGIDEEAAVGIWEEICSFGAWGMNKSHTVAYSVISYWCAWMKAYHPLDYAAALLRNAKDDLQVIETLRELVAEGVPYVPFDAERSEVDWRVKDGTLFGGFTALQGIGPATAAAMVARRDGAGLTKKDKEKLASAEVKFADLREAHTKWGPLYEHPEAHSINGPVREFAELTDRQNVVVIAKVVRRERRDENETVRRARRGGADYDGPNALFLDLFVVDDSITKPVLARVGTKLWPRIGERLADNLRDEEDWVLLRGRWLGQFSMLSVDKIKVLTQPELALA